MIPSPKLARILTAGIVLAIVGSHGSVAAPNPPTPPTHINGYFWKHHTKVTPAGGGDLISVDVEITSAATPSAYAAMGTSDTVEVFSFSKLDAASPLAWNKEATLSGRYVSIDATTLAVGKPDPAGTGFARVYQRSATGTWSSTSPQLTPSVTFPNSRFGQPVELDGSVLVVGAPNFEHEGRAFVFELQRGGWVETAILGDEPGVPVEESLFGQPLAVSDGFIAIGQTPDTGLGSVLIYHKEGGNWVLTDSLQARDPANPSLPAAPGDLAAGWFGKAIVLNGTRLAVASNGYIQVFERTFVGGAWEWNFQESFAAKVNSGSFHHRPLGFDGSALLAGQSNTPLSELNPSGRVRPLRGPSARPIFPMPVAIPVDPDSYLIKENPLVAGSQFGRSMAVDGGWLVIGNKTHMRIYAKTVY